MVRTSVRAEDPNDIDGRYRLVELIGRGGSAEVYRAHDRDGRAVAIKLIPPTLTADPVTRPRFEQDLADRARLDHPCVVRVLDHGTVPNGSTFIVMELVDGEDLRVRLARDGRVPPAAALVILAAACAGVDAAHRAGIVHGDLKPENILLPRDGTRAKVADFVGAGRSQPDGTIIGTPAYMAPEQLRGEGPDGRADVFSLGVVAFEMLAGMQPFGRGSAGEVRLRQAAGIPRLRAPGVNDCLERAVASALALDPDRRPPTTAAYGELLESARPA